MAPLLATPPRLVDNATGGYNKKSAARWAGSASSPPRFLRIPELRCPQVRFRELPRHQEPQS